MSILFYKKEVLLKLRAQIPMKLRTMASIAILNNDILLPITVWPAIHVVAGQRRRVSVSPEGNVEPTPLGFQSRPHPSFSKPRTPTYMDA